MNVHRRCWSISRLITPNRRFTYIHVHVSMEHSSCLSALIACSCFFPLKLGFHCHDHHRAHRKPIKLRGQHLFETRTPKQVSFDDTLGAFLGVLSPNIPNSSTVLGASPKRTPMFIGSDCQLSWRTYYLQIIHNWNHRNFQWFPMPPPVRSCFFRFSWKQAEPCSTHFLFHCQGPTASTRASAPRAPWPEPRRVAHSAGRGPVALQPVAPRGGAREERGAGDSSRDAPGGGLFDL